VFDSGLEVLQGRYEVKFFVDGQWRLGGEGWDTVVNEQTGVENNVLEVP
jgi:Glycogen recognition site of AMP-activated protein kinase